MKTGINFSSHLAQFLVEWEIFKVKFAEKIKKHFLCLIIFFFENRAGYDITLKSNVEPGRPQMTVRSMCIACWIPRATNTHSEYVILIAYMYNVLLKC